MSEVARGFSPRSGTFRRGLKPRATPDLRRWFTTPVSFAQPARALRNGIDAGFTLIEVVVAIGIFAIGMVAVIGMFSPLAKSVGDSADAEAATHVADLLNVKLQTLGFDATAKLLKVSTGAASHQLTTNDAKTNYNNATDTQLLFASRDGTKIGAYADVATWGLDPATGKNSDREKYFEIALIRNESISPNDPTLDATAPMLAYTARLRWPAFVALAGGSGSTQVGANPTAAITFDYSQREILFFSGAVTR